MEDMEDMEDMDGSQELLAQSVALATAAAGNLDVKVPTCPQWRVAELVAHLGEVHAFWADLVERRQTVPPDREGYRAPAPNALMLLEWFLVGAERLAELLEERDPTEPVWTWHPPDQTVGWVRRRVLHETAMHRWDVQAAVGESVTEPFAADVAADGIDEYLTVFLPSTATGRRAAFEGPHGLIAVEARDWDAGWRVQLGFEGPVVVEGKRGSAANDVSHSADAVLRGPVAELLLVLWRRRSVRDVEVTGEAALVSALIEYADLS